MTDFPNDPISRIEWRLASSLEANAWNPNRVFTPELKLLERSLQLTGWVQPILISADGLIIDGFHRHRLAQDSKALMAKYGGMVPCAVLQVDRPQAMLLTVRMNRAKGTHVAVLMSQLIHELIDVHNYEPQELAVELGATLDEIALLHQDGVFKAKGIDKWAYSPAWYPEEVAKR